MTIGNLKHILKEANIKYTLHRRSFIEDWKESDLYEPFYELIVEEENVTTMKSTIWNSLPLDINVYVFSYDYMKESNRIVL